MAEYREIAGHPGYRVGDDGTVWSCKNARWGLRAAYRRMKTPPDNHGYLQLNLSDADRRKRHFKVHVLVLLAFVGPRPAGLMTRHLDGDRSNNRLDNLAYGTALENALDTVRHGRTNKGERCPAAKLSDDAVRAMRARHAAGETQKALAIEFGVCTDTVCAAVNAETWSHLED